VTQKYRRNKDEHSHSTGSNIPKISGEIVGEKEVQKATNSRKHIRAEFLCKMEKIIHKDKDKDKTYLPYPYR
jgi:hypothetical protein